MFSPLLNGIKDLLFPKFCAACNSEGSWLCEECLVSLDRSKKENIENFGKDLPYLDKIMTLFDYTDSTVAKLIQIFKYQYLREVGDIFEAIISKIEFDDIWHDFTIVPVPLHTRRKHERGFNQAEIIADIFSRKFKLNVDKNLQRAIYTVQQVKLSGEERMVNLRNAFVWKGAEGAVPKKILLVDDVFTTGATMHECAAALKNNGAELVYGLALARG